MSTNTYKIFSIIYTFFLTIGLLTPLKFFVVSDIVTPEETKTRDDKRVLQSIWKLLDEADIVIGHNGDRFDLRKLNARFIDNDINPPSPFRTIDTLKVARREFAFVSYTKD